MKKIKLVLVGDGDVEKTALWVADVENRSLTERAPTVLDNYSKIVNIAGEEYHLNVWDTSGNEKYDRFRPLSYPKTNFIIVIFSVGEPASYSNATTKWIPEVKRYMPIIPIVLLGNKIEIRTEPEYLKLLTKQNKEPITTEVGEKLARTINAAAYVESSCLDQTGVKNIFEKAIKISQKYASGIS